MGVLIGQREYTDEDIDKIVFVANSDFAFELISVDGFCTFKYDNGELLIEKLLASFKKNVEQGSDLLFYFRRLVFLILVKGYNNKYRKIVIDDLNQFSSVGLSGKSKVYVSCLIKELELYNKKESGETCTKEQLCETFGVGNDFFYRFSSSDLKYPLINVENSKSKIITIDSPFCSIRDDAVSIEKTTCGYLLGVYISDVASSIMHNKRLYNHSFQRCESVYLGDKCGHMLPDNIRSVFSLRKGSYNKTIGYFFKLDDNFNITGEVCVKPVNIQIYQNYTFGDIDNVLRQGGSCYTMLNFLSKFYDKNCALFNLEYHSIKERYGVVETSKSIGSSIVEVLSLFLNSYISQIMKDNKYPFIYRVNESDLMQGLSRSYYSSVPLGHVVTNDSCYGRVTAPIRKFSSLLNQYFVTMLLMDDKYRKVMFDREAFKEYWFSNLPCIVDKINLRMLNNPGLYEAFDVFGINECPKQPRKSLTR